ncbi:MAG: hypothetical protein J7K45_03915 [Thaumarchaeota archaeon]|nr:hypothetical protein [Nitrososphaerota archaeon]
MEFGVMVWGRSTEYFVLPSSYMERVKELHEEYLSCIGGRDKERAYEISEEVYKLCKEVGKSVDRKTISGTRELFTFYLKGQGSV